MLLAVLIGSVICSAVDSSIASFSGPGWDYTPFATIFTLAVILPDLAVTARRLHDIGKTGWWQLAWTAIPLLALIPIVVGVVVSIVIGASEGSVPGSLSSDGFRFNLSSGDEVHLSGATALPLLLGFAIALLMWLGVFIWWLVWMISQGQAGPNRHGPDPRASDPAPPE